MTGDELRIELSKYERAEDEVQQARVKLDEVKYKLVKSLVADNNIQFLDVNISRMKRQLRYR